MKKEKIILVVSTSPDLANITRRMLEGKAIVDYARNEREALDKISTWHPDVVILGDYGRLEDVFNFRSRLTHGWISRHSSVFILQEDTANNSFRLLDSENLVTGIGDLVLFPSAKSPFVSVDSFADYLREKILERLKARVNELRQSILDPNDFCLTWEQIPGQGAFEVRQAQVLENARKAAQGKKICAISVVDNPGGNPAISTEVLSSEIRNIGIEPIVHVAFRDKSRNQVESMLYQLAALDVNNLLILTGDYPSNVGFQGKSRPVFDLDSVQGLQLVKEMNQGMEHEIMRRKSVLTPTDFFAGVAFSPYKQEEAEVLGQYYKLQKKIAAGADFVITQIGYDIRKLEELQLWIKKNNHTIQVLISIHVLSLTAARAMNANRVPGCVVTDNLLSEIERESAFPDKGRKARLDRAAKMYAISRGLGFTGACISGQGVSYESVEYIIEKGRQFLRNWPDLLPEFDYPQKGGFYFFKKNTDTGLNSEKPAGKTQKPSRVLIFFASVFFHAVVFDLRSPLFKMLKPIMRFIDSKEITKKAFGTVEFWTKAILYGCMNCGDCSLFDVAYLCPVSQCPKNQRNGPCGGSFEGWCEVYPYEKKCIWVRAYRRLKPSRKEEAFGRDIVPPCNWDLWQTSSWLNYFMGRDHVSKLSGLGKQPNEERNKNNAA